MTEIIFLGTGCMQPTKQRNHAGVILRFKKETLLFDCGEGTQRQLRIAGLKPAKVSKLFISHFHGDHVFGIPGLLSSMGADESTHTLKIYGPTGSKQFIKHMLLGFAAKDIQDHEVIEVSRGTIFEDDDYKIETRILKHSVPCIGFSFIEKERLRIDTLKADKLKLAGPVLGELQDGKNVVVDGKKIMSSEVTYLVPQVKISYVTDTAECPGADALASDCDLLILEGTLLHDLKSNAAKSKHLTVKQAANIALQNNAKKLVLTHISQRYKSSGDIMSEAREVFDDVIVAEDFMKIKV
jgi:ribonuclease Z